MTNPAEQLTLTRAMTRRSQVIWFRRASAWVPFCVALAGLSPARAQQSTTALAAAAQNPVAAMISLPFQNNTYFGVGPNHDKTANALNIQPVLPFTFGNWNIISRTIVPIISLPTIAPVPEDIVLDAPVSGTRSVSATSIKPSFYHRPRRANSPGASGRRSTCRLRPIGFSARASSASGLLR